MWNGQCGVILSKNTDITDAHGWDFSRIGYSCASKGKSVETEHVMFTFTLAGRGMALRFTQGVASLALGYGGHWAFSPLGQFRYSSEPCGTDSFACGAQHICGNQGDLWETLCADGAKNWRVICFPTDRRSTQKQKGNTIGVCILRTRISRILRMTTERKHRRCLISHE